MDPQMQPASDANASYTSATIQIEVDGEGKVSFRSDHFDGQGRLHMKHDQNQVPDRITFQAPAGCTITALTFRDEQGNPQPGVLADWSGDQASVTVDNENATNGVQKYTYCVTVKDGSGNTHTSDPKIFNEPSGN